MSQSIYCDESGFTGTNLSDVKQPFFVYSSIAISKSRAEELLGKAIRDFRLRSAEIKGRKLVKSSNGQRAVSFLLEQSARESQSVVYHKKYTLACKLFEYIFEPALSEKIGIFYGLGFHKFVSTLLLAELQTKNTSAEKLVDRFEHLMRTQGPDGLASFFGQTNTKRRTRSIAREIVAFAHGQRNAILRELETIGSMGAVGRWTLDITDSALYSLLCHWAERFDQLDVYCDESKPLSVYFGGEPNLFAAMVGRTDKQYLDNGGEKELVTFNLERPVSLVSSKDHPGIQIADTIAASISYALKNRKDAIAKYWLATLENSSALHRRSVVPFADDADVTKPRGNLNRMLFRELIRRSRKGIDLLEGIEDFMRFPFIRK